MPPSSQQHFDCYQVLALQSPLPGRPPVSQEQIKQAYRRALLSNHPDKSHPSHTRQTKRTQYTIDQVTKAYQTLIDSACRRDYDTQLWLRPPPKDEHDWADTHSGIDTLDLDQLNHDPHSNEWYCGCRCGDDQGYRVTEDDLQTASEFVGRIPVDNREYRMPSPQLEQN
ncbi:MAG: hypothetical protein L6R40_002975 [Gallowayella cf. fulva]|nr:MAG: hypothetical protein L6R40_002975 [Xanthomendoza cf. fulva]